MNPGMHNTGSPQPNLTPHRRLHCKEVPFSTRLIKMLWLFITSFKSSLSTSWNKWFNINLKLCLMVVSFADMKVCWGNYQKQNSSKSYFRSNYRSTSSPSYYVQFYKKAVYCVGGVHECGAFKYRTAACSKYKVDILNELMSTCVVIIYLCIIILFVTYV